MGPFRETEAEAGLGSGRRGGSVLSYVFELLGQQTHGCTGPGFGMPESQTQIRILLKMD